MRAIDELDEVMDRAYNGEYALGLLMVKARTIRARERKLAELAREAFKIMERAKVLGMEDEREADWIRRYEEACK